MNSRECFGISSGLEFEDDTNASASVSNDFFEFYNVLEEEIAKFLL